MAPFLENSENDSAKPPIWTHDFLSRALI